MTAWKVLVKVRPVRATLPGLALWLGANVALGAPVPTGEAPRSVVVRAEQLRREGKPDEAVVWLKSARESHPSDEPLVVALGAAYLDDDNPFWALNVLTEFMAAHPPACQARAWAAWAHVEQANLDQAQALLEAPQCSTPPELASRFLLLSALVAHHRQRASEVVDLIGQARAVGRSYAEDEALLENLSSRYEPGRMPLVSWSVDAAAGATSDGLAGAPVDEETRAQSGSMVALLGARVRSVGSGDGAARPVVEVQARAQQLTGDAARDLSYRQLFFRPGALFGRSLPRLELRYGAEAVHLQGGDRYTSGPMWYSEAHRAEYELEATESLTVFGGGGYRVLRDRARTRVELDEGAAWAVPVTSRADMILGASARWMLARASAYTELGATLLAQADVRLLDDFSGRALLSLSGDTYPHSEGYFQSAGRNERRELLFRGTAGLWRQVLSSLRGGLEYAYTERSSTASDYGYVDHRALLRLQWTSDSDELQRTVVPRQGRVALETGFGASANQGAGANVRELLRQDDAAQRGASCLK